MLLNKINSPQQLKKLSLKELNQLSWELRSFILENVCKTGGHLASNLGSVEITLAVHYFFNCPYDKVIWDVGHQSYAHKILTGRRVQFKTLRQEGGISGFPRIKESPYDAFGAGHASTSISAAMGMAEAFRKETMEALAVKINQDSAKSIKPNGAKKRRVAAVIGDGSLTGGLALEAINQIGYLQTPVIIILNDNRMSISPNVGSISRYTKRVEESEIYQEVKRNFEKLIGYYKKKQKAQKRLNPETEKLMQRLRSLKTAFKAVGTPGLLFEKLGIHYLGPVDGHSISQMLSALKKAEKKINKNPGPVLIHARTIKGYGYKQAEEEAVKFHGVSAFSLETGCSKKKSNELSFSDAFGAKVLELAKKDKKIIAITAAMTSGTGLNQFANELPQQAYDVGICEEHAVTFAAGMAAVGFKPVVVLYSTFLQRAYDQVIHDVCLQNLPVVFALDRAGLVGEDGATHHGVFDLSYLRHIPNLTIMAPKDNQELGEMLELAFKLKQPVAVRYPRGSGKALKLPNWCNQGVGESLKTTPRRQKTPEKKLKFGQMEIINLNKNKQAELIVSVGTQLDKALKLGARQKIKPTIVNARFIKPIDAKIFELIKKAKKTTIIEENVKAGGFGSALLEGLAERDIKASVKLIGIPDKFIEHGKMENLRKKYIK